MTYGCKIMVSLTLCSFFGPPCILIVTGVEIIIGNCLPEVDKILPNFTNRGGKFPRVDYVICHFLVIPQRIRSIWHRCRDMAPQR